MGTHHGIQRNVERSRATVERLEERLSRGAVLTSQTLTTLEARRAEMEAVPEENARSLMELLDQVGVGNWWDEPLLLGEGDTATAAIESLLEDGVGVFLLDLPLEEVIQAASDLGDRDLLLFNIRHGEKELRGEACSPVLFQCARNSFRKPGSNSFNCSSRNVSSHSDSIGSSVPYRCEPAKRISKPRDGGSGA